MKINLPEWATWLDVPVNRSGEPVRHRVLYGGRGGAKSWTIAHKLVELCRRRATRVLCLREFQNSIRDSSKKLIEDCIERMGLGSSGDCFFTISEREIRGRNGSLISFMGLNGKDASIKSMEGYDLAWVEEAATLSQSSMDALIPTIRRPGSEIWWSYNPRFQSDPVDRLFRGNRLPPGSIVLPVSWNDNPWFPDVLRRDMEFDYEQNPEKHAQVWLGGYVMRSEAQIFQNWQIVSFVSPEDAIVRFGADWGFSRDPTVLVRCFIGRWSGEPGASDPIVDPAGRVLFVDFEAYAINCQIDDIPGLFAGSDQRRPERWLNPHCYPGIPGASKTKIIADSARPETIAFLKSRGFNIEAAIKGPRSLEEGIEFLQNFEIVVHPRCTRLVDELIHYCWAIDRQTGDILNQPADRHNHLIDALRYALEGARKAGSGGWDAESSGDGIMTEENLAGYIWGPTYGGGRSRHWTDGYGN